jgi:hypothetical protein
VHSYQAKALRQRERPSHAKALPVLGAARNGEILVDFRRPSARNTKATVTTRALLLKRAHVEPPWVA